MAPAVWYLATETRSAVFSALTAALPGELKCNAAVVDGEIVCVDEQGRTEFNELLFRRGDPRFFAFDLLWCDGKDLRYDGLHERKRQLSALIAGREHLLYCDHLEERGEEL
jgi:bifunctional non-homologous end joining protein LigD